MKKLFLTLICASLLVGCHSRNYSLDSVEFKPYKASPQIEMHKASKTVNGQHDPNIVTAKDAHMFSDELVGIGLELKSDFIKLAVLNKSASTIKILWDDCLFINQGGSSQRVIREGVMYKDVGNAQVPSPVAAGSTLSTAIIPAENINLRYNLPLMRNISMEFESDKDRADFIQNYMSVADRPAIIKLLIAIEASGKKIEYTVSYSANKFETSENWAEIDKRETYAKIAADQYAAAKRYMEAKDYGNAFDYVWNAATLFPSNKDYQLLRLESAKKLGNCEWVLSAKSALCKIGADEYCTKTCD